MFFNHIALSDILRTQEYAFHTVIYVIYIIILGYCSSISHLNACPNQPEPEAIYEHEQR